MVSLKTYNERIEKSQIPEMIYKHYESEGLPRPYIGMSGLGGCIRSIWFSFRQVKRGFTPGKLHILFNVGHAAEKQVIEHLEAIGMKVEDSLDDQAEFSCAYNYCLGHGDGTVINVPGAPKTKHLLEIKTANDKSFNETEKKGVKKAKYGYYCQMVIYMHHAKLTRALFVMYNKNTSAYYAERVYENKDLAKQLIEKAETIVWCEDYNELPRIGSNSISWYECVWCSYKNICFDKEKVEEKNCRTCGSCNLIDNGKFGCKKGKDYELSLEEQRKGCELHEFMDCLK